MGPSLVSRPTGRCSKPQNTIDAFILIHTLFLVVHIQTHVKMHFKQIGKVLGTKMGIYVVGIAVRVQIYIAK